MNFKNDAAFAAALDHADELSSFRSKFYIPIINQHECIYFTGNSLGLQSKNTQDFVLNELEDWANFGVEGHLHARNPWLSYHEMFPKLLAPIVGGREHEIVVMNQLTVNLHLLMATFYQPSSKKYKIICEAKAFSSDQYVLESQVREHGYDPSDAIIEISPREKEHSIQLEDILNAIERHKEDACLVFIGGVNYYSGQVFDMYAITEAAHKADMIAGFDLAHAAGNIPLQLHDWQVDFAAWCSYKYLNSGPGGVSGVFIHEKHSKNTSLHRLAGWWGHQKSERFNMEKGFNPIATAEGWQLSNAPILSMAAHKASLEIFAAAGVEKLFSKAKQLSDYLFFILNNINNKLPQPLINVITPVNEKGCQASMQINEHGKSVHNALTNHGIITDWREPNVIRVAPVPLYNSFTDIFNFGEVLYHVLMELNKNSNSN